jgi:nucleoid DNA-binding protein
MTRKDLARAVASELEACGVQNPSVERIIEATMKVIRRTVSQGDTVTLRTFGNFCPQLRKEKKARVVGTGEPVIIREHYWPGFQPTKHFRNMMPGYQTRMKPHECIPPVHYTDSCQEPMPKIAAILCVPEANSSL